MKLCKGEPFYSSEVVKNSLNPSWKPIDLSNLSVVDAAATSFIVRVWNDTGNTRQLMIEWILELSILTYLGPELDPERADSPNTVIFELLDGYYQADEVAPRKASEADEVRSNMAKVDKVKLRKSYTQASIEKTNQMLMAHEKVEQELDAVKRRIQQKLDLQAIILKKFEQKEALTVRLSFTKDEIERNQADFQREKRAEGALRESFKRRREALQDSKNKLEIGKAFLEMNILNIDENKGKLKTTVTYLVERRWELLSQLETVFSVKPVDEKSQLYKICGIPLPNTEYAGFDEEQIASALGYISQAVVSISNYFEIPLRYSILPASSRSIIRDDISYPTGTSQEFPLYPKGVERFRFDYGVFLLNKDIEQLLHARGHGVPELRNTLPNIHVLLEHEAGQRGKKHERGGKSDDKESFEILSP